VVDVETTGLSASFGDRVCEIGIVLAQGDAILDTYQTLVNPQRPISPGAASVNGLSDADMCQAPIFAEIADQALERIDGSCWSATTPLRPGLFECRAPAWGLGSRPAVIDTLILPAAISISARTARPLVAAYLGIETPQAHRAWAMP
jgi:DNA polymerase-3 subunit epsilon